LIQSPSFASDLQDWNDLKLSRAGGRILRTINEREGVNNMDSDPEGSTEIISCSNESRKTMNIEPIGRLDSLKQDWFKGSAGTGGEIDPTE
jgi:hypothetical protein